MRHVNALGPKRPANERAYAAGPGSPQGCGVPEDRTAHEADRTVAVGWPITFGFAAGGSSRTWPAGPLT